METLDRITIDPKVCLGQPTIRGMRLMVSVILKMLAGGHSTQEVLDAYPELEEEDVRQALQYASKLASSEVQRMFNLRSRLETDQFLKNAGAFLDYSEDDFRQDIETLRRFSAS